MDSNGSTIFPKWWRTHTIKMGGDFDYSQINTLPCAPTEWRLFVSSGAKPASISQTSCWAFRANTIRTTIKLSTGATNMWASTGRIVGAYVRTWRSIMVCAGTELSPGMKNIIKPHSVHSGPTVGGFPNVRPPAYCIPGTLGSARTAGPPGNLDFAPRIGLAYSPNISGRIRFSAKSWEAPAKRASGPASACFMRQFRE